MADEVQKLAAFCRENLSLADAKLGNEYYYSSLPLCVIDAVFSIGVTYESTQNTVVRYAGRAGIPILRPDKAALPLIETQQSIDDFLVLMVPFASEQTATKLFNNHQRTSTKNGILKSQAVFRFADALHESGVNYFQDVPLLMHDRAFEDSIKRIPGQASGISLRYFHMLAGDENGVKPDRMLVRFLESALGKSYKPARAAAMTLDAARLLQEDYPDLKPRTLDHAIWRYQRER
jgi:hypothetical protein